MTDESQRTIELGILGNVLLKDGETLETLSAAAEDFHEPRYGSLWEIFQQMKRDGRPVNISTVMAEIAKDKNLQRQLGADELSTMLREAPITVVAEEYTRILAENAARRRLMLVGSTLIDMAQSGEDSESIVAHIQSSLEAVESRSPVAIKPMSEEMWDTIKEMEQPPRYVATPWQELNDLIAGWRPEALYVIGARPGSGKTLVALQAAVQELQSGPVLMCTLEMGRGEIHKRVFSQPLHIPLGHVLNSNMSRSEWERLKGIKADGLDQLYINDDAMLTVEGVKRHATALKRGPGLSMIVVDYLQLMGSTDKRDQGRKRHEEIARWTRSLKILSKTLGVPVVILSQLNRESTRGSMPGLADLRESGAIEQDADCVILLHREDPDPGTPLNVAVAKNRQGRMGNFSLDWDGEFAQVHDPQFKPSFATNRALSA